MVTFLLEDFEALLKNKTVRRQNDVLVTVVEICLLLQAVIVPELEEAMSMIDLINARLLVDIKSQEDSDLKALVHKLSDRISDKTGKLQ